MLQNNQNQSLVTLKMIWMGMLGSQIIIPAMLYFQLSSSMLEVTETNQMFVAVFATMATLLFGLAIFLPRFMFKAAAKTFNARTASSQELLEKFTAPYIIRLALFETITLFGFSLGFLHHNFQLSLPFIIVGIAAVLFNHPTENKIKESFQG